MIWIILAKLFVTSFYPHISDRSHINLLLKDKSLLSHLELTGESNNSFLVPGMLPKPTHLQ